MTLRQKIKQRADFLQKIRYFFQKRDVLEVDTPLLRDYGVSDPQLVNIKAGDKYLITSPEYAMKILLCQGAGDIYQLSHVFRGEECGRKHRQEFMLLEWYRLNYDDKALIQEVKELIFFLLPQLKNPPIITTYSALFQEHLNIDITQITKQNLKKLCAQKIPESRNWALDKDGFLDLLFTHYIEPKLGKNNTLQFINEYPTSQAALARTTLNHKKQTVAKRFEAYLNGIELCNGFHELNNSAEQRKRFIKDQKERAKQNLPPIALDEPFLNALEEQGLPDCAGVAVGIDRLLMIHNNAQNIKEVML